MATPIGTNTLNSISRRYIIPVVHDNLYRSNVMFFRLNAQNKVLLQGGLQIEVPILYANFAAGGPYSGFDLLDVSPSDTVKNAAFDWKQYDVPVAVDGLTLIKADSPQAVMNFLSLYFQNAQLAMADNLGTGLWSDAFSNPKAIDGIRGAIDNGTVVDVYGGLSRTTNTWWKSQRDAATATLTLASMQAMFGSCSQGGRHPTIIVTTQANYDRYWALSTSGQAFPAQPSGHDEQLAQNGFTNLLFNGVPILVDSKVPTSHIFFINEDYFSLYVQTNRDFVQRDFREPVNQDAMVAFILWAGNLCCKNVALQGVMTAVAA